MSQRDPFDHPFFKQSHADLDRRLETTTRRAFSAVIAIWIIGAICSLGVTAAVIWGVVALVRHFA